MSILALIGILLLLGVLVWAIRAMPWIDVNFKTVAIIILVVFVALWLISAFFGVSLGRIGR
jgi:hypothetical protein